MVGMGVLMLAVSWFASLHMLRHSKPSLLIVRLLTCMTFAGWIATVAGWYTTEIGRQPYLVYGLLTTAQAASHVPAAMIGMSLGMYLLLYAALTVAYISVVFYLARHASDPSKKHLPESGFSSASIAHIAEART
jgi:cytochrome d ubiquinol oxidase subunit I